MTYLVLSLYDNILSPSSPSLSSSFIYNSSLDRLDITMCLLFQNKYLENLLIGQEFIHSITIIEKKKCRKSYRVVGDFIF